LVDEQGARTVSGRKMSDINLQHLTAIMLLDGDISFEASHDPARSRDRQVLALKDKVELVGSAELSKAKTTQAIVEVTLARIRPAVANAASEGSGDTSRFDERNGVPSVKPLIRLARISGPKSKSWLPMQIAS
jgi:2-methylcitrate dehydratase PrpD